MTYWTGECVCVRACVHDQGGIYIYIYYISKQLEHGLLIERLQV